MTKPGRTNFGFAFPRTFAWFAMLFLLAFSGQASATLFACEIQTSGAGFQTGNTNGTLTYTIDIVETSPGDCGSGVSGTITQNGGDTTGGASVQSTWNGTAGTPVNVVVTLGPNPGGQVDYDVVCTAGCFGGNSSVAWTARTFDAWLLTPTSSQSLTTAVGQSVALGAQYTINGGSAGLDTFWSVDDTTNGHLNPINASPDGSGNTTSFFWGDVPGVYTITAEGTCPSFAAAASGPTTNCPPNPLTYTVTVENVALTPVQPPGGSATVAQNSAVTLKVRLGGTTIVLDDQNIAWDVTSEPSAGAGDFSGGSGTPSRINTVTDANGETQVTLNVTSPGTYTVLACNESDGCLTNDYKTTFTITVSALNADLSISKTAASPNTAPGGQVTYTIAIDNAGPDAATNVVMSDTLPAALTFASVSTTAGWSCSTPAVGANGTVSCQKNSILVNGNNAITLVANVSPSAPVGSTISNSATVSSAADGNTADNTATATVTVAASAPAMTVSKVLTGTVDNDNSSSVSAGDRLDYEVTAKNTGNSALPNVVVTDDHFSATQTCATLAVNATCVLTGSYVVTAADVTAGSVTNIGKASSDQVAGPISSSVITPITSIEPVTLGIGTGDGQSAPINTPFPEALTVVAGGVPPSTPAAAAAKSNLAAAIAPNVTINWQVMSGSASLQSPSSVTDSSGIASNHATAGPNAGPVVIRASRADDSSTFVEFHLTVTAPSPKFSELPGLNENQKELAEALDEVCSTSSPGGGSTPGLAASATSSSGLGDLLARCEDLLAAIDTDPEGVIKALDQLLADIGLVQSESSLLAAETQFDNIKARIAALRSGTNRTGFEGLAFRTSSGSLPIGTMFQSLFQQEPATEGGGAPKEVGTDFSRWGFFASGTIGRGDADQGALSPEYDFDIDGLTVGADYRVSDKLIFGGTLGYTKQTNDLANSRGSLDTKGWSVSGYGTWYQQNSWYVDGVLSWGQNSYDIERRVHYTITTPSGTTTIDNTGHGNGDGDSLTFALSLGRDFNKGGWGFGPYLRAMYTKMDFDSLTEDFDQGAGNGLALEFDTRSITSMTSTLGGKLTYAHSTDWGVLIPHLQLEWQHEFEDDPSEVEARFLYDPTGTPFTIHGDPIDTDFFRFGVGMSFIMTKGRSGFFYYERLISRERFSQNSLALGIRLEF
jgi:outer membrane autotransporter protein/uncharacterized repeat protein (TIGR01451 family)